VRLVIHHEKRWAFHTRERQRSDSGRGAAGLVELDERVAQEAHVGDGEVVAFGAGWRTPDEW
jgi:hypothetical protein